jgi:uncharacterized membrane protein YheB (UPF0754 family)
LDFNLLIINLLAGSLVGYVTKSLAINMLFKKYPLIGGAEIIKDRENLEIAMSRLVEERLIKPSTLLAEFQKESFKDSFKHLIQHILLNSLQANLQDLAQLEDLKGFSETTQNLRSFLMAHRDEILPVCLDLLLDQLHISDIQSSEQWDYFLAQILAHDNLIGIFLEESVYSGLRKDAQTLKLGDCLSFEFFESLLKLFVPASLEPLYKEQNRQELAELLTSIYNQFFLDADWSALNQSFQSLSIAQLLAGTDFNHGLEQLIESVLTFLDSVKGQYLLLKIMQQVIRVLKQMDVPLSDFLTERLEQQAISLIEKYLPEIIEVLELWLRENKDELETLIQSAIGSHLQSENLVKQMIGSIFGQQLTARYQVVENTLQELKTMLKEQGPGDISALVTRFLNHTKVNLLVGYLEKYILNEKALVTFCLGLLQKYLPRLKMSRVQHILELPLSSLPILNQLKLEDLAELAFQGVMDFCQERILGQTGGGSLLNQLLKPFWPVLKELPLSVFLPENPEILLNYSNLLIKSDSFHKALSQSFRLDQWDLFKHKSLSELASPALKKALCNTLNDFYEMGIDQVLIRLKQENIRQIYASSLNIYTEFSQNEDFMNQITHTLVELMVDLIRDNQMLDGKIYIAIKESFARFSDDELKDEMDSFMGSELQPIKLLGAFLGAAVGVGMWYVSMIPGYGQFVQGNWALLSYSLSYALTEVGTNWMAIKMLFHPYKTYKIPGTSWNLPFTPGIFPKNKPALADSMVNFVDKKLLSKDNMVKILEKYHPAWKKAISHVVSLNDYAVVNQALRRYTQEQYGSLTPFLLNLGFSEMNQYRFEMADYLIAALPQVHEYPLNFEHLTREFQTITQTTQTNWLPELIEKWSLYSAEIKGPRFPSSLYLSSILPGILQTLLLPQYLAPLRTASLQAITTPTLAKQPLNRFLSSLSLGEGIDFLFDLFATQLEKPDVQKNLIELLRLSFLKLDFPEDSTLGEVFDGRLINTVLQESDFIFDAFAEYLLQLAKSKQTELTGLILADIETKGVMEFMLLTFGGVREDIRKVVAVLIDEKLPLYLNQKREQLQNLFETLVKERVANIPLKELGLTEEMLNLEQLFALIKHYFFEHPALLTLLKELSEAIASNSLTYLNLQDIAYLLSLQSEQAVYERIQDQAQLLEALINQQWLKHQNQLMPQFENFFEQLGLPLADQELQLFTQIPTSLWLNTFENTSICLSSSPTLQNTWIILGQKGLPLVQNELQNFLEPSLLKRDLGLIINKLTSSEAPYSRQDQFKRQIQTRFEPLILEFVDVLNQTIGQETKSVIQEITVNSLIDSLRVNNRELLEPIDFESIVRKEIAIMEPERIESLFDFAKPIFRLLVWYGAWGGVIGLAVGIFEWLH